MGPLVAIQTVPLRADGVATLLVIRLTPRGERDVLEPARVLSDGSKVLCARVRAAPENGGANKALLALVAEILDCPNGAVTMITGATSRLKTIRIEKAYREVEPRLAGLHLL